MSNVQDRPDRSARQPKVKDIRPAQVKAVKLRLAQRDPRSRRQAGRGR
jgi:hypothetical protein